jgi:hypothetical protein
MSNASITIGRPSRLALPSVATLFVGATAGLIALLRRLDRWLLEPARDEPRTPQEVLDLARRIESTDPGMAADLRAAVMRAQD